MDKYFMRVALVRQEGSPQLTVTREDGQVEKVGGYSGPASEAIECWEYVENDVVLAYLDDNHAIITEYVPGLQVRYIAYGDDPARTMYPVE